MELTAEVFDALTVILFGIYWPILIVKTWRTRRADDPPMYVMTIFLVAYACLLVAAYLRAAVTHQPIRWPIIFYWLDMAAMVVAYVSFVYLRLTGESK